MYSVNQVNQFYCVTASTLVGDQSYSKLTSASNTGAVVQCKSADGSFQYFQYKSPGGIIATDRIKKGKVKWVTYTPAEAMRKPLRTWTIAMNANDPATEGTPVVGQHYIINFAFRNYFGMSDEDTYEKFTAAIAFGSASDLIANLAVTLAKNFSREIDMPFTISVKTKAGSSAATYTAVTPNTKVSDLSDSDTSLVASEILLTEFVQPYERGRMKLTSPDFTVRFSPIVVSGVEDRVWATCTEGVVSGEYIKNGYETADLEWFCMGERGDQYRGKDWPLSITTPEALLVSPTGEYDYVVIHFWDDIDNEGPQKSERDMTIVASKDNRSAAKLADLAASVAGAAGLDYYTVVTESSGKYVPVATAAGLEARVADLEEAAEGD
jgi:hypothetical protein